MLNLIWRYIKLYILNKFFQYIAISVKLGFSVATDLPN